MKRQLADDPVDLSVHCSGLMLLIAYGDRLQLLYILRYAPVHNKVAFACMHFINTYQSSVHTETEQSCLELSQKH